MSPQYILHITHETYTVTHGTFTDENEDIPAAATIAPCRVPNASYDLLPLGHVKLTSMIDSQGIGLSHLRRGRRGLVVPDAVLHHDVWDLVLCEGVPVSLRELIALTAAQLKLQLGRDQYKLLQCNWYLGWHITSFDGDSGVTSHYWGGGVTPGTSSAYLRGDWVEIAGTEPFRGVQTSRLARVICGVNIRNIKKIFGASIIDNKNIWQNKTGAYNDEVVYLLVRYAEAHPDCGRRRGPECRPLCPGELQNTHCLWKWSKKPQRYRRGCWRPRPWERHKHLFGDTPEEQQDRKEKESHAWYDLIQTSNIISHTNVQVDFDREETFLQSVMWC